MVKKIISVCLVLFFSNAVSAQNNIAGTWEGTFMEPGFNLGQPKLVVEIYSFKDSLFTGISHLYYTENRYEHYKIAGKYIRKDSLVVFKEVATIAVDLGIYGNCLGIYLMGLRKQANEYVLYGLWNANIAGCTPSTKVWMLKKPGPIRQLPPEIKKTAPAIKQGKMDKLPKSQDSIVLQALPQPAQKEKVTSVKIKPLPIPDKITERETDVQSLLEIPSADKDSIRVDVYDNGEIDGDSVSVYEEETLRINRKKITEKPLTFYVTLNKNSNPIAHLRLVAESLGTIPPCTALMIVTTKSKRYEVRLASNFSKNATVELFLKE